MDTCIHMRTGKKNSLMVVCVFDDDVRLNAYQQGYLQI